MNLSPSEKDQFLFWINFPVNADSAQQVGFFKVRSGRVLEKKSGRGGEICDLMRPDLQTGEKTCFKSSPSNFILQMKMTVFLPLC